jgi:hypothetical protein
LIDDFFLQKATLVDFKYFHWDCTTKGQRARYGGASKHNLLHDASITEAEWGTIQHDIQGAFKDYKPPAAQDDIGGKKHRQNLARSARQKAKKLKKHNERKKQKAAKKGKIPTSAADEDSDSSDEAESNQTAKDLVDAINAN